MSVKELASHLLQANYDISTIQELLGHSDVRSTMIYTHTVNSKALWIFKKHSILEKK
ncbi:tyrosine-type recombinase/integrase [Desulfobacter vibrioformis]|uniref:tyrosine-type recombinase/integrase n=1 Tax=Desulfobacter vibrioformis TaxID=34031 RepID=UPI003CCBFE3C